jgi:hypothetical protein
MRTGLRLSSIEANRLRPELSLFKLRDDRTSVGVDLHTDGDLNNLGLLPHRASSARFFGELLNIQNLGASPRGVNPRALALPAITPSGFAPAAGAK